MIDENITKSGFMDDKIVELTNGKKTIKRKHADWEINQKVLEFRGYSLVKDKPKKKKGKK
jgi:uncharacterized protein YlzI (FlbEa/FlbD family)